MTLSASMNCRRLVSTFREALAAADAAVVGAVDLLLVAVFHLGTAIAPVFVQMVSVVISFLPIRRREPPFLMDRGMIRWDGGIIGAFRVRVPVSFFIL